MYLICNTTNLLTENSIFRNLQTSNTLKTRSYFNNVQTFYLHLPYTWIACYSSQKDQGYLVHSLSFPFCICRLVMELQV